MGAAGVGAVAVSDEAARRFAMQQTEASFRLSQPIPELTPNEQFEMAVRLAQLEGFASRLINLNERERRIITLGQIQDWAEQALGKDRAEQVRKLAREIVERDAELLNRLADD